MDNLNYFIGKRVSVQLNDRDFKGNRVWNKYTTVIGICTHIGYNDILKENQINIDRSPFFIDSWDRIKLIE